MKVVAFAMMAVLASVGSCMGQTLPVRPVTPATPVPATAPVPPVPLVGPLTAAPEALDLLKMLHDRKDTLKEFVAKIDYSVTDPRGSTTGKLGTVSYLLDPAKGPIFSTDFDRNTTKGKPSAVYHSQVIFDGIELTIKDWGLDGKSKTFLRSTMLPPGAKPGDAVTLKGALPLPIGLDVNDVLQTFEVTHTPSPDPDIGQLKLIPRVGTKFEYKQLDVTVDRKLQLPITLAQTAPDDVVTTIKLTDLQINTGAAKMLDPSTPASEGWTPKAGGTPATPAAPGLTPVPAPKP